MRILVLAHGFPPHAQGGSEIYAFHHARGLASLGHDVLVLTRESNPGLTERAVRVEQRDGMRVAWVNNTFADTADFADSYEHPRLAEAVLPLIDSFAPNVAHAHHLTCLSTRLVFALSEGRVPIVYTLHDYWLMCHRGQLLDRQYRVCDGPGPSGCGACVGDGTPPAVSAIKTSGLAGLAARALPAQVTGPLATALGRLGGGTPGSTLEAARADHMRLVCDRISHFLAPSRHMRDTFIRFGIAPERITWSPYGFDHGAFRPARPARASSRPLQIGFIGSLMVSKAPHVLLDAHRRLAPGRADVHVFGNPVAYHGDDSYRQRLAPLLRGPGVHVHGPKPHREIPQILARLDVLVVPSVWAENSPLVIQEALLAGVPVVASRIGGIPELITHGENGLLFEAGSVDDLAGTLSRLAEDPSTLARLRPTPDGVRTIEDDVAASVDLYTRLGHAPRSAGACTERIAAVVINYRTPEATELTLRGLLASDGPLDEVIVVNNDLEAAPDRLTGLATAWIHTGANLGFSGGVNAGVREARARGATHVLLVNSDVVVPPDVIARLRTALDKIPGTGIAGPIIASQTYPDVIASAGISYHRLTGRMRHHHFGGKVGSVNTGPPAIVDAVSGCVMLVRCEVFEDAGLFEEQYFYGFEDIDFCLSAASRGYLTVCAPDAVVYHHGAQSIGPQSPKRLYFGTRNHLLLASRLSRRDPFLARLLRGTAIVLLNGAHAVRSPGGSSASRLAAVARGVRDYASGTFGPGR